MGLLDDAIREHLELKRRRGADPAEVARAEQEALGPVRREPEPAAVQDSVHEQPVDAHLEEPPAAPADTHAAPHPGVPETFTPEEQTRILAPHDHPAAEPPAAAEHPAAEPPPYADPADAYADAADAPPAPPAAAAPAPAPPTPAAPPAPGPAPDDDRDQLRAEPPPHAEPGVHPEPASETATPPHGDPAHDEPVDPRHSDIVHQPTTEWRIEDEDEPFADAPEPAAADGPDEDVLEETPDFLQETPEHDRLWFEQRPPRDFDFDD